MFNSIDGGRWTARVVLVFLALLAVAGLAARAEVEAESGLPEIIDARLSTTEDRARLIVDLTGPTEFAVASLTGPDRIAVDLRVSALRIAAPADVAGAGLVADYAMEMAEGGRARTLVTLARPAVVQQAYVLKAVADQPARLVVDFVLDTAEGFAARAAADLEAALANRGNVPQRASTDPGTHGDVSTTRPLVVIDPGHGGIDNGATAPNGVHEKEIVLAFALQLQEVLVAAGRFDVALTREDDSYLSLNDRVALARQNKADLFISLHADSFAQAEIRGASVYTRDERATDVLDRVLAAGENKFDIVAGFAVPEMQPAVVDILVDLMRRQMRQQSFLAAQSIIHQLEPSVTLRRFPVRQADFFVLQAPDVPSILVELGFLSNADDVANLQRSAWRDRVVDALARGIAEYFDGLEPATVAQQN